VVGAYPTMKEKTKLLKKVYGLIRKARIPRFLHHFGPKKFTSWQHLKCLILKQILKCSFDTLISLLPFFGIRKIPKKSTLIKFTKRISAEILNKILSCSAEIKESKIGAIDATGFSRTCASEYYVKRIDRDSPTKSYVKTSIYVDVCRRKILSARVRAKPAHDVKDVDYLLRNSQTISETNIMDKGYDSNKIHEKFRNKGKYTIIPARKGCVRGMYRKEMRDYFDYSQYWQRNIIESVNSSVKRKFGSTLKAKKIWSQRCEIMCKLISYNLSFWLLKSLPKRQTFSPKPIG